MNGFYKTLNIATFFMVLAMLVISFMGAPKTEPSPSSSSSSDMVSSSATSSDVSEIPLTNNYKKGMYSWDDTAYSEAERTALMTTLEALSITELYQSITDKNLYSSDVESLLTQLKNSGIDTYYLTGQAEWGLDISGKQMKLEIDKIASYNKAMGGEIGFKGIVLDVEPYLTNAWKEDEKATYAIYVNAMKNAYTYANEKGLRVIVCIPNWFDRVDTELLKSLVAEACDEVAVMNYNRRDEITAMEGEVAVAREQNKPISCIFEFQDVGKHSLTENETYRNAGINKAIENFEALRNNYSYEQINFAYHYLKPVYEMLTGNVTPA